MKKYRHKQTWIIAEQITSNLYRENRRQREIPKMIIENSNDWEDVSENKIKFIILEMREYFWEHYIESKEELVLKNILEKYIEKPIEKTSLPLKWCCAVCWWDISMLWA